MRELRGRVAVVTGAGSGIGRALVLACAEAGMHTVAADIDEVAAAQTAAQAREHGVRAIAVHTDVSERASVDALAERAYAELAAVHLLCNNAGVTTRASVEQATAEDWGWLLGVNFFGAVHGVQAFLPRMRAQGGEAHIVNTASLLGLTVEGIGPPPVLYASSKYAVTGFSEALRIELASEGIGVSMLCPAAVRTQLYASVRNRPAAFGGPGKPPKPPADQQRRMPPEEVAAKVLEAVRANRAYVLTHPDSRAQVEARFKQILDDFEPQQ